MYVILIDDQLKEIFVNAYLDINAYLVCLGQNMSFSWHNIVQSPRQYCGLVKTDTVQTKGLQETTSSKARERKVEKRIRHADGRAEQYQKEKQII